MKFGNYIYLDSYATIPCSQENSKFINKYLSNLNPSTFYAKKERLIIENLRLWLTKYFKTNLINIVFNSGGSEGNSTIINSCGIFNSGNIVCSNLDHPCVVNKFENLKTYNVDARIAKLKNGKLELKDLTKLIDNKTTLVILTSVFSELGNENDIYRLAKGIKINYPRIHLHLDAVQSFLKTKLPIKTDYLDSIAISFHKIGALKGSGALWVRYPKKIVPLISGEQNFGIRGGTMSVANLASAYFAIGEVNKLNQLKSDYNNLLSYLTRNLQATFGKELFIFTNLKKSLGNCCLFSLKNICGKDLQEAIYNNNIIVGRGSACKSSCDGVSVTIKSFNLPEEFCSPLRVSWNKRTTQKCIDKFLNSLIPIAKTLKNL